jgi:hypothetical protein
MNRHKQSSVVSCSCTAGSRLHGCPPLNMHIACPVFSIASESIQFNSDDCCLSFHRELARSPENQRDVQKEKVSWRAITSYPVGFDSHFPPSRNSTSYALCPSEAVDCVLIGCGPELVPCDATSGIPESSLRRRRRREKPVWRGGSLNAVSAMPGAVIPAVTAAVIGRAG